MAVLAVSGVLHYVGLSTDVKPTDSVPAGSTFLEVTAGSPNTIAKYVYDGADWGLVSSGVDITGIIAGVPTNWLSPQVATGTAVLDETTGDWSTATDFVTITPAAGSPLRAARLDLDLAKASTGFAANYAAQTLTLQVWRKTDGTNWRAEAAQTAITGTNAALRAFPLALDIVGVDDAVKVTAKLSAEKDGSTVSNIPYRLHYVSLSAPTVTASAGA